MSVANYLEIKSGFIPYDDGSGYRVEVEIRQETKDSPATITIDNVFRLEADRWPEVVEGIERLLRAVKTDSPSPSQAQT